MKDFKTVWYIPDIGMTTTSQEERARWIAAGRKVIELMPKDEENVSGLSVTSIGESVEINLDSINPDNKDAFQQNSYYLCRIHYDWFLGFFSPVNDEWVFTPSGSERTIPFSTQPKPGLDWQRIIHLPVLSTT